MNGFINLFKPSHMTSSNAVVKVRKILHEQKVGHLGTLDPLANGVLPIAVGKATKLFNLLLQKQKTYRASFTFGFSTDTLDSDGNVTEKSDAIPNAEQLKEFCKTHVGKQMQLPPAYSAKSVNGERAYRLARKGEEVQLQAREIEIFSFELVGKTDENTFDFEICCSSGTYIRAIARDMAAECGACGHMSALTRTKSGCFDINGSITLEELQDKKQDALVPVEYVLQDLPAYRFDEKYYSKLKNGVKLPFGEQNYHRIYCRGQLFGVGKSKDGLLDLEYYLKDDVID